MNKGPTSPPKHDDDGSTAASTWLLCAVARHAYVIVRSTISKDLHRSFAQVKWAIQCEQVRPSGISDKALNMGPLRTFSPVNLVARIARDRSGSLRSDGGSSPTRTESRGTLYARSFSQNKNSRVPRDVISPRGREPRRNKIREVDTSAVTLARAGVSRREHTIWPRVMRH